MLHFSFERRLFLVVSALLGASAILAVALTPALSGQVRPSLQSLGIISCSSSSPCQEGKNAGTGSGLEGISAKGKGVIGQTTFNSTSSSNGQAGVLGQDKSTSGTNDVGVKGTSTNGTGVVGVSTSATGVVGTSGSFLGCGTRPGVCGTAGTGNGVYGASTNDNGGEFHAGVGVASEGRSGVFATDDSTSGSSNFGAFFSSTRGVGVEGYSNTGAGVVGQSNNWVGVNAVGGFFDGNATKDYPALSVVGDTTSFDGSTYLNDIIDACPAGTVNPCRYDPFNDQVAFRLEQTGDLVITGIIVTRGSCNTGCLRTPTTEKKVSFYTPQESLPTVEDFGQAQLISGQTYVHIDPAFANTIDVHAPYMVFITPEGDN